MDYLKNMRLALAEMESQAELFQPTVFWGSAASQIANELEREGIERFRSLETILGYFVPTYGCPGNGLSTENSEAILRAVQRQVISEKKVILSLKQFLSGYEQALADYRVSLAAGLEGGVINFSKFSESTVGQPIEQFNFGGRKFSRSSLNYLLGLSFINKHLFGDFPKVVMEIGGGFGSLGEILLKCVPDEIKYIDIDIPPISTVAEYYLSEVFGEDKVLKISQTHTDELIDINKLPQVSVLKSWQVEKVVGKVDLFVNFISFQEMEPLVVENYLKHVDRLEASWILLRNLREGKQIKTENNVGVEQPIFSDDYVRLLPNYDLVDSSIFPFGYRTVDGFNSELLLFKRHAKN